MSPCTYTLRMPPGDHGGSVRKVVFIQFLEGPVSQPYLAEVSSGVNSLKDTLVS